jgi:hypothetical protein
MARSRKNESGEEVLQDFIPDFRGGMVTAYSPEQLAQNCFSRMQNCTLDTGIPECRYGYSKLNAVQLPAAAAVRSMWHGRSGAVGNQIIAISGSKIYSINRDTGTATERATGLNTSQPWSFCEAIYSGANNIVMVAPNNLPYRWDGVAASASTFTGPATNGDYVAHYGGKLVIADADLRMLYLSDPDFIYSWDVYDGIVIGREEDGPITGLLSMGRYLLVFMQKAVYLVFGNRLQPPQNFAIDRVDLDDGCPAPFSIQRCGKWIFWVGNEGFYVMRGKSAKRITTLDYEFSLINKSYIHLCQGGKNGHQYWVSVPSGVGQTVNNLTYVVHYELPTNQYGDFPWTYFSGLAGNCFAYSPGTGLTYFGSSSAGWVYKYNSALYTDDGTGIDYDIITRGLHFGDKLMNKALTRIHFEAVAVNGATLNVSSGANNVGTGSFIASDEGTIALDESGKYMGAYSGATDYARNGVVNYPLPPESGGSPIIGEWFRVRFRSSATSLRVALTGIMAFESVMKSR